MLGRSEDRKTPMRMITDLKAFKPRPTKKESYTQSRNTSLFRSTAISYTTIDYWFFWGFDKYGYDGFRQYIDGLWSNMTVTVSLQNKSEGCVDLLLNPKSENQSVMCIYALLCARFWTSKSFNHPIICRQFLCHAAEKRNNHM